MKAPNVFISKLEDTFKKFDKPFSLSSQTVVCALDSVINDNIRMKPIKLSVEKKTIYDGLDKINGPLQNIL